MARLANVPEYKRAHLQGKNLEAFTAAGLGSTCVDWVPACVQQAIGGTPRLFGSCCRALLKRTDRAR